MELNPEEKDTRRTTWKEYELIQPDRFEPYRREITWSVFNEKANRFANMLLGRGCPPVCHSGKASPSASLCHPLHVLGLKQ